MMVLVVDFVTSRLVCTVSVPQESLFSDLRALVEERLGKVFYYYTEGGVCIADHNKMSVVGIRVFVTCRKYRLPAMIRVTTRICDPPPVGFQTCVLDSYSYHVHGDMTFGCLLLHHLARCYETRSVEDGTPCKLLKDGHSLPLSDRVSSHASDSFLLLRTADLENHLLKREILLCHKGGKFPKLFQLLRRHERLPLKLIVSKTGISMRLLMCQLPHVNTIHTELHLIKK